MQWSSSALVNLISMDQLLVLDNITSYNVFHIIEHGENIDVPLQIDALPCKIKQDNILAALMQLLPWVCLCVLNNSHFLYCTFSIHAFMIIYRSLVKKGPWAVHITLCLDRGVGGYCHEKAPMFILSLEPTTGYCTRTHPPSTSLISLSISQACVASYKRTSCSVLTLPGKDSKYGMHMAYEF